VIAGASHDTASAVAAIPDMDDSTMFISSGTWSLVGTELKNPLITPQAFAANFANEGGVAGTTCFLRNVCGLWLIQECMRAWQAASGRLEWDTLLSGARAAAPLKSFVDPDNPRFLSPVDMPLAIQQCCHETNQPVPETPSDIARCCLESLALKYRCVLETLEKVCSRRMRKIVVVGGGAKNSLLCQLTANACRVRVVAGTSEATALGNALCQAMAMGYIADLPQGREAIAASFRTEDYLPLDLAQWDAAYERFFHLLQSPKVIQHV
jgi:rhamnulokinase